MEVETIIQVNKIEFSLPKTKLTEEKKTTGSIRVPKAKSTGESSTSPMSINELLLDCDSYDLTSFCSSG